MSADVLMTGTDGDLLPTDLITDTENSRALLAQQVDTNLHIAEGEWPVDILSGIDWIGYFTDRRVNMQALTADVKRAIEEIPNILVTTISGRQVQRTVQINIEGVISQVPFQVNIVTQPDEYTGLGDDGILVPLVLQWGSTTIRR